MLCSLHSITNEQQCKKLLCNESRLLLENAGKIKHYCAKPSGFNDWRSGIVVEKSRLILTQ